MQEETRHFFNYLLAENRNLLEFVDSDYTFLNGALARHYGIPGVTGGRFEKVSLLPEHNRGGLLGHGSILTATSNGVETQPVVRGVWILENLLHPGYLFTIGYRPSKANQTEPSKRPEAAKRG